MEEALNNKIIDHDFYELKYLEGKYCSSYHEIKPSDDEITGQGAVSSRIPEKRDCLARVLLDPKCT